MHTQPPSDRPPRLWLLRVKAVPTALRRATALRTSRNHRPFAPTTKQPRHSPNTACSFVIEVNAQKGAATRSKNKAAKAKGELPNHGAVGKALEKSAGKAALAASLANGAATPAAGAQAAATPATSAAPKVTAQ
jgi:hypothetical protein